jgi:hypothetical protein
LPPPLPLLIDPVAFLLLRAAVLEMMLLLLLQLIIVPVPENLPESVEVVVPVGVVMLCGVWGSDEERRARVALMRSCNRCCLASLSAASAAAFTAARAVCLQCCNMHDLW